MDPEVGRFRIGWNYLNECSTALLNLLYIHSSCTGWKLSY